MIAEELKKYLDMVKEETENGLLNEMSNLDKTDHGIDNVVMWIGRTNKRHGLRIKVSNKQNSWNEYDNFTIMIPSLDYDHAQVAKWIRRDTMDKILLWIKINQPLLYRLDAGEYSSFRTFVNDTSKV